MNLYIFDIEIQYDDKTQTQKVNGMDEIYKKIGTELQINPDELVLLKNNSYHEIIPRQALFSQYENIKVYYAYDVKALLKEKLGKINIGQESDNKLLQLCENGEQVSTQASNSNLVESIVIFNRSLKKQHAQQQSDPKLSQNNNNTITTSQIDFSSEILKSVSQEIYQVCFNCKQLIVINTIQTKCQHHYHLECLQSLCIDQLLQKNSTINCHCKQRLNIQLFVYNFKTGEQFKQTLFQNQLQEIQQKYREKIRQCKFCQFFIIQRDNINFQCFQCNQNGDQIIGN